MSSVGIYIGAACVLLAIAHAALHLQRPSRRAPISRRTAPSSTSFMERRDAIYDNLRDLRFEYRAGKYSEKDYEEIKQSLEIEAARVLADMDTLTGSTPTPATRQAATEKVRNS